MSKITMNNPVTPPAQTDHANANTTEQEQARHRTAIRIVGIEGIEVFADLNDTDVPENQTH